MQMQGQDISRLWNDAVVSPRQKKEEEKKGMHNTHDLPKIKERMKWLRGGGGLWKTMRACTYCQRWTGLVNRPLVISYAEGRARILWKNFFFFHSFFLFHLFQLWLFFMECTTHFLSYFTRNVTSARRRNAWADVGWRLKCRSCRIFSVSNASGSCHIDGYRSWWFVCSFGFLKWQFKF